MFIPAHFVSYGHPKFAQLQFDSNGKNYAKLNENSKKTDVFGENEQNTTFKKVKIWILDTEMFHFLGTNWVFMVIKNTHKFFFVLNTEQVYVEGLKNILI